MKHIVIYGAAGFVATTFICGRRLPPCVLTLVDPAPIDRSVLDVLRENRYTVNVVQSSSLLDVADEADVLLVVAGQTDVDQALAAPAVAFETNMTIAVDSAEWWLRHPGTRLVYLSSDEVLGPSSLPLGEGAPLRPTQPYAASKAAAEMTLRCYSECYGLDLVVIRSCNLVGGRQRACKLIPTAVENLVAGIPVPIFGDGLHQREYLAVEDLCEVISWAVNRKLPADVYNCTSGVAFSTIEVVRIVAEALEVEPRSVWVGDRLVHDRAYAMDASKLHSRGWEPRVLPAAAIVAAVIEMREARKNGESLTRRV